MTPHGVAVKAAHLAICSRKGEADLDAELFAQHLAWTELARTLDPRADRVRGPAAPAAGVDDYVRLLTLARASGDMLVSAMGETALRRLVMLEPLPESLTRVTPAGLEVSAVDRRGRRSVEISFHVPERLREPFSGVAGQHVTLHVEAHGIPLHRSYSVLRAPRHLLETGQLTIGVRHQPSGVVSTRLVNDLQPGARIAVSPPAGFMVMPSRPGPRHVLLIGAGSGVTPLIALAEEALESHSTDVVTMLIVEREESDLIGAPVLERLRRSHPDRLALHLTETTHEGRPTTEHMADRVRRSSTRQAFPQPDVAFICGPPAFTAAATEVALLSGVDEGSIGHESFEVTPREVIPPRPAGRLVVDLRGDQVPLHVQEGETLLWAILRSGRDLAFSCLSGNCGSCAIRVSGGGAQPKSPEVLGAARSDQGWVLACQASPS